MPTHVRERNRVRVALRRRRPVLATDAQPAGQETAQAGQRQHSHRAADPDQPPPGGTAQCDYAGRQYTPQDTQPRPELWGRAAPGATALEVAVQQHFRRHPVG